MSDPETPESKAIRVEAREESPVLHAVEVEVEASRVGRAFDRAYRDLAKRVQVRGFRPGKVPRPVLERLYGASVSESVGEALVAETLPDAVEQTGLEPVAEPLIETGALEPGASFRFTARLEVKPAIALPDLAGLPARRPRVEVSEQEVEEQLEQLRQRHAPELEEPEGTEAAAGHIVTTDFVGRIEGKPFEGGAGQGVDVEIGAGRFLDGFEEGLLGARSGEDRELRVSFPADYANEELAGKEAVFAAHVVSIKRRQVPALDDDFAKDLGDFGSLEELRERVRSDLSENRERSARAELHRTLMDALIERTPFDVPPGMVERQLQQQLRSAHQRLEGQLPHDALHEQLERWKEEWRERAERLVREVLLLEAVAREHSLQASAEEVEARIHEMAAQQGTDPQRLRKTYGGEALEEVLKSQLTDDKALEFLAARAKVEETTDT